MAVDYAELKTTTRHTEDNPESHVVRFPAFGGQPEIRGPVFVATLAGEGPLSATVTVSTVSSPDHPASDSPAREVHNPLNAALEPMTLTPEEAAELDQFLAHPTAFPRVPIQGVPEIDPERDEE